MGAGSSTSTLSPYDGLWLPTASSPLRLPSEAVAFSNGVMNVRLPDEVNVQRLSLIKLLIHVSGRHASMALTMPHDFDREGATRVSTFVGRVNATRDSAGVIQRFRITFADLQGLHLYKGQRVARTLLENENVMVSEDEPFLIEFERLPLPGFQIGPECNSSCALARSVGLPDNSRAITSAQTRSFLTRFYESAPNP